MTTPFDLTGRTALVTGASRGIGRAIAVGLAAHGADVALASRDEAALREVAAEVEGHGRRSVVLATDVTDDAAVTAMVAGAIDALGGVDVLVNNAGGSYYYGPFTTMRLSGWEKTMRLNVDSVVRVTGALAPHLLERGRGSVVNVASVGAFHGMPKLAPYGASKAALLSLTRTLALEWATTGVRVNALCPGWTATELNRELWDDPARSAAMTDTIPMDRWGTVAEMVGPAVFLASDASAYMTGSALMVDGGIAAV